MPPPPVFVDSTAWLALLHDRDQAHTQARRAWPKLVAGARELVTTNLVVAESHSLIARRVGVGAGLAFLEALTVEPSRRVVWVDQELTHAATVRWVRRFRDKAFGLTDAVSFEVMRREGIREAFAFDQDFERAGFALLS